jgi:two-component system sensor kinase FixL
MRDYAEMTRDELIAELQAIESAPSSKSSPLSKVSDSNREEKPDRKSDMAERLRAILQTAVEGIITIDEHGMIESLNPAAERTFGYKAQEVIGKNVSVLMPSPYREEHDNYMAHYRRTGHAKIIGIGREVFGQRKDGSIFPLDLAVSEVRLADRRLFNAQRRSWRNSLRLSRRKTRNSKQSYMWLRTTCGRRWSTSRDSAGN